jgi:hypothetical protein
MACFLGTLFLWKKKYCGFKLAEENKTMTFCQKRWQTSFHGAIDSTLFTSSEAAKI